MPLNKKIEELKTLQSQPIELVAFSGGGAKGNIYSGVYKSLKETGVIDGITAVSGSSAGAIAAAVTAIGIQSEEFDKISKETNLKKLLGEKGTSIGPLHINKDGRPLYDLLDTTIRGNVSSFLKPPNNIKEICSNRLAAIKLERAELNERKKLFLRQQTSEQDNDDIAQNIKKIDSSLSELQKQQEKIEKIIENEYQEFKELAQKCAAGGEITFKDLALLRVIDPIKFKDLLITAVRRDTGELVIFNADNSPDVSIAAACRASASIPLVFEPAIINGIEYVDGGYRDNVPTKYFDKNEPEENNVDHDIKQLNNAEEIQQAKKKGRVLALAFGSNMDDPANIAIYSGKNFDSPSAFAKFLMNVIFKWLAKVGGDFKYTETELDTANQLRENALNTVIMNTQGIDTLSFDDAQKYADYLGIKGFIQTSEYLDNHQIGKECSPAFPYQKFFLEVYEHYDAENLNKSGVSKLIDAIISFIAPASIEKEKTKPLGWEEKLDIKSHDDKANALLDFCKETKWQKGSDKSQSASAQGKPAQHKPTIEVLKDFVLLAASPRSGRGLKENTKSMESLIKTLNSPTTGIEVKKQFIDLLGVDRNQDPRLNQDNKPHDQKVAQFKFTQKDFTKLLETNKTYTPPSMDRGRAGA